MTDERILNSDYLEKLIIKTLTLDKTFLVLISNAFIPEFFDNSAAGQVFKFASEHLEEFNSIPSREIIFNTLGNEDIRTLFEEIDSIDFDIKEHYDYILKQTNDYLKDQAIRKALFDCVDIVENKESLEVVRNKIEDALCKDIKVDLGLSYFRELGERLRRIFTATEHRIPTYYPTFDELVNGGFPPLTLSVIVARIHGFKSNTMANWAARQVLHGHNVALLTLEMSQDMFAQRFDSIYSKLDINRMYFGDQRIQLKDKLIEVKATPNRGELYIKQYPTGAASVRDFRIYLRELIMRGIKLSIIYVDYINLMKAAYTKTSDLYISGKSVAEELRALSFEFEIPVVSVSQLNREGAFVGFEQVDFNYIAESIGVPATADFMSIIGVDEDKWVYEHELHNKIVKNRLGGRINEIWKCYYDERSLKMYDETELDEWLRDATLFHTERQLAPDREQRPTRRRRNGND